MGERSSTLDVMASDQILVLPLPNCVALGMLLPFSVPWLLHGLVVLFVLKPHSELRYFKPVSPRLPWPQACCFSQWEIRRRKGVLRYLSLQHFTVHLSCCPQPHHHHGALATSLHDCRGLLGAALPRTARHQALVRRFAFSRGVATASDHDSFSRCLNIPDGFP